MSNLTDALIAAKLIGGCGGGSGSGGGLYIEYAKGSPTLNLTYKQVANAITGGNSVKLGVAAEGPVGATLLYSCVGFMSETGNYMAIFAGIFGSDTGHSYLQGDILIFSASSEDDYLAPTA